MTLPHFFMFDLGDGQLRQALVADGRLVTSEHGDRTLKTVGRYLKSIGFLDKRNLTLPDLCGVVELFGQAPAQFRPLSIHARGPGASPSETPRIEFRDGAAAAILYAEWQPSVPPGAG